MPSFQGSGLLSLAGSLYGVHTATAALRQSAASSAAGIAEDRAIIDRTINEEDRRLAKAKRRVVRAQRRAPLAVSEPQIQAARQTRRHTGFWRTSGGRGDGFSLARCLSPSQRGAERF